jgi:hypothetical protein
MVAVVPPLLSDAQPSLAERAGFGDRFHYWRGRSGRRYLFTAVSAATVEDFRFAVVIIAERTANGRLAAREAFTTRGDWRLSDFAGASMLLSRPGAVALVHLLAVTRADRQLVLADLSIEAMSLAA